MRIGNVADEAYLGCHVITNSCLVIVSHFRQLSHFYTFLVDIKVVLSSQLSVEKKFLPLKAAFKTLKWRFSEVIFKSWY